jgi:hypothetical protein
MSSLILKRAPIGQNQDDYDVLCDGEVVGRIMLTPAAPESRQWMWTLAYGYHEDRTPAFGYEPTREAGDGRVREELATRLGRRRLHRSTEGPTPLLRLSVCCVVFGEKGPRG